jgi:hypothetical protein
MRQAHLVVAPSLACASRRARIGTDTTPARPRSRSARTYAPAVAALALAMCISRPAGAQTAGVGRIDGRVTDSVHARPLAGVRVVAAGTGQSTEVRAEATTDSIGRYRVDSLPPGSYVVGFESPLLDSLEMVAPPRTVTIPPGGSAKVDLALPRPATLRAALCPGLTLPPDAGVVYGHVVIAETGSPLAGAAVALQWRELAVWDAAGSKKLNPVHTDRTASVVTDAQGWYRACGVPTGAWVSMQLQREGRVGPVLRLQVDDSLGIAIRHLSYSPSATRDTGDVAIDSDTLGFTGTASLTGIIRGPGDMPIPSARVRVRGARSTSETDAQGRYTLSGLPAGTQQLDVRRIGYGATDALVELRSGSTTRSDVRLERVVSLDSVRVVAVRSRYPEFTEHRKFALGGRFLGPEVLQRRHDTRTSDIIRAVGGAGFLVENRGPRTVVYSARSVRRCIANVVIDGSEWGSDPDLASVDDVNPHEVGAIELYQGGEAPPEYDHGCGAVLIWTKR